jgi:DNA repair protein RecO (recombination protein O)
LFSYGNIVFSDAKKEKLTILTEFEQQPGFTPRGDDLFALNCCLLGTELLNNMTNDYDPHPELFDNFLQFLQNTNETPDAPHDSRDTLALLILFQLALLKEVGLQPVLNACVNCKNNFSTDCSEIYFSSLSNGLICRDCEASFPDKIRLKKNAARCLINLKMLAESNVNTLKEVEKILVHHFTEILHRPPKMAKHILTQMSL